MKALYRFEKRGPIRYISHLDLQRTMHRAILRAGLPVEYSKGFHPLPEVSFAQALALGVESVGEYMQIVFAQPVGKNSIEALNGALPPGLKVNAFTPVDEGPSPMAAVAAAKWQIETDDDLQARIGALLERETVFIHRKSKHAEREFDIRPGILELEQVDGAVVAMLSAGSAMNVRAAELLEALELPAETSVLRLELYAREEEGFVPLLDFYKSRVF